MPRESLRFGPQLRGWGLAIGLLLFMSGAGWLALHTWGRHDSEFGPQPNAAEPWLLRIHGASAMAALLYLGAVLPLHVARGYRARANRVTGWVMLLTCGLLVTSGYALYYAGVPQLREPAVWVHDAAGLALPALLGWHIWCGRKAARRTAPD